MRITTTLILILFSVNAIAQFTFNHDDFEIESQKCNVHRITQTEKGEVTRIKEYDSLGRMIFSYSTLYCGDYWNKKYIYYLRGYVYDSQDRLMIEYYLHSNAGHIRTYYQYDSVGNKTIFINKTQKQTSDQINTNPYHRISEYKNYNDLITSSEVKELNDNKSSAKLYSKEFYNNGKIVKEIQFNEKQDTNWIKEYIYDKNRISKTLSYSYSEGEKRLSRIFTSKSKSDTLIIETLLRVGNNSSRDTIFHIHELYNRQNKILVKKSFKDEKIEVKKYFYNANGKLLYIDYDEHQRFGEYPLGSRKVRKTYKYNGQGLVKKEKIIHESPREKEKRKFKYKIEYY